VTNLQGQARQFPDFRVVVIGIFHSQSGQSFVRFSSLVRPFHLTDKVAGIQVPVDIYIRGYETMKEVNTGLREYFKLYNEERFHQGLDDRPPDDVYFGHGARTRAA